MMRSSRRASRPRRNASRRATSSSDRSMRSGRARYAPTVPSAPMRERYFERREIKEAIAFAEDGGIAVHRNFDSYHGSTIRGMRREKPFLHVIGLRPALQEWGRLRGLRPEWIQPEKRRKVAHYDVVGPAAEALLQRLWPAPGRDWRS